VIRLRALDADIDLNLEPPSLRAALEPALRPLERPDDAPPAQLGAAPKRISVSIEEGLWILSSDSESIRLRTAGQMLARTLEFINTTAAASITNEIPMHAAAVADEDGRVVILAGRSGAGKSTLGAAATMRGWRLVAEEVAATHPASGLVRAYHRPIGLRSGGAAALGVSIPDTPHGEFDAVFPWSPPIDRLTTSGHVLGIALVRRQAEAGVEDVRPALGLSQLAEHMVVPVDARVPSAFRQLEYLVRQHPVAQLTYDDVFDGVGLLEQLRERWT
jgi:energy-coupling factor transporter ATP-binding protein EcfA2